MAIGVSELARFREPGVGKSKVSAVALYIWPG